MFLTIVFFCFKNIRGTCTDLVERFFFVQQNKRVRLETFTIDALFHDSADSNLWFRQVDYNTRSTVCFSCVHQQVRRQQNSVAAAPGREQLSPITPLHESIADGLDTEIKKQQQRKVLKYSIILRAL